MKAGTVTIKGQITIPKEFRDELGWRPGDGVGFVLDGDRVRIVRTRACRSAEEIVEWLKSAP